MHTTRLAARLARALAAAALATCSAADAQGQSAYLGAAALADVARFGSSGGSGEVFGGAVRVGTAITDRWGLDVEFTVTGAIREELNLPFDRVVSQGPYDVTAPVGPAGIPVVSVTGGFGFPRAPFRVEVRQRFATMTATPWIRQRVGGRAELVYLGGIAFVRSEREVRAMETVSFSFGGVSGRVPLDDREAVITYSAAPVVGLDFRLLITERLRFVTGVRLIAVNEDGRTGWLTRPSLGLQLSF